MSKSSDRRKFLKNLSVGSLAAGVAPATLFASKESVTVPGNETELAAPKRAYNTPYTGENLNRIAFPIGRRHVLPGRHRSIFAYVCT
jgi:hypothetical protein